MTGSSGACETNEAASKAAWSAAAAASPELAAPREIPISKTLAVSQRRWSEQKRLGISAQGFAHKYNLTVKSLADQTFLTAGDDLFGSSFGDWVEAGNHAPFNATDLENYNDCLQRGVKTVNIYLALNRLEKRCHAEHAFAPLRSRTPTTHCWQPPAVVPPQEEERLDS